MRILLILTSTLLISGFTFKVSGQPEVTGTTKKFLVSNVHQIILNENADVFKSSMDYRILPKPHPGTDKLTVDAAKAHWEPYRKANKSNPPEGTRVQTAIQPVMLRNYNGNNFTGFVPNDNDMAISNHDVICSVTNSSVWSRDQINNVTYGTFSLHSLTASLGLQQEEFDPKVLFDPVSKRFILVCLNGFTDSTSNILLGFSQDSVSYGAWNFYTLPGDPLNNNLWTDFPMIAVTNDELFITANLLYNDSTWQAGFNQTIIWQINKNEGYAGSALNPLLHYDIKHNNEPIRNLCPVKGGMGLKGPNMYFVSNRNFAIENDTIFLVEVTGLLGPPAPQVTVSPLTSTLPYRMPLNAVQTWPDQLIVNDARILGAFIENDRIQFVSNFTDTTTGKTAVFHGAIDLPNPISVNANYWTIDSLYLGYPNIAYAGTGSGSNDAIISILYSSASQHPGVAAAHTDGNGNFSTHTIVRAGTSYTNMLVGNERWGDYTGCHTRYGIPGVVWVSGSYSITNHTTRTWIGEMSINSGTFISEPASGSSMNLFPNPVHERVNVEFDLSLNGLVMINLYDAAGKLVQQLYHGRLVSGKNNFSFDTSSLRAGSYTVNVIDENKKTAGSKTFLKQ
jgi:hypothetical protein